MDYVMPSIHASDVEFLKKERQESATARKLAQATINEIKMLAAPMTAHAAKI